MSGVGLHKMSSISTNRLASCSRRSRGSVVVMGSRSERHRGAHRLVRRERHVAGAFARFAALAKERRPERRERDLELRIVRLDGRDLLDEKTRQEKNAQRARRAMTREEALDLEGDRRE